jgi:hypothetical protein
MIYQYGDNEFMIDESKQSHRTLKSIILLANRLGLDVGIYDCVDGNEFWIAPHYTFKQEPEKATPEVSNSKRYLGFEFTLMESEDTLLLSEFEFPFIPNDDYINCELTQFVEVGQTYSKEGLFHHDLPTAMRFFQQLMALNYNMLRNAKKDKFNHQSANSLEVDMIIQNSESIDFAAITRQSTQAELNTDNAQDDWHNKLKI